MIRQWYDSVKKRVTKFLGRDRKEHMTPPPQAEAEAEETVKNGCVGRTPARQRLRSKISCRTRGEGIEGPDGRWLSPHAIRIMQLQGCDVEKAFDTRDL